MKRCWGLEPQMFSFVFLDFPYYPMLVPKLGTGFKYQVTRRGKLIDFLECCLALDAVKCTSWLLEVCLRLLKMTLLSNVQRTLS